MRPPANGRNEANGPLDTESEGFTLARTPQPARITMGKCFKHIFDEAIGACRTCQNTFCEPCLVFAPRARSRRTACPARSWQPACVTRNGVSFSH